MKAEEAIRILASGGWYDCLDQNMSDADAKPMEQAIEAAIAALRAQQTTGRAVEGMCCYCIHGGPCCGYEENADCEYRKFDGSCWKPRLPAKLDRSRWEGCELCGDQDVLECMLTWERKYCNNCGRPLTEEAWAELERRINGTVDQTMV